MLTVEHATRRFSTGTLALDDVTLRIEEGDFLALLGPSGCGKSTLLRLIAGLERSDRGQVRWDHGPPRPGRIGFVFQDPTLLPWATAADNVRLPLQLRGVPKAQSIPMAQAALDRVGLGAFAEARPSELSGGMRMRVSIARALVGTPDLLLMDEPFAALDEFTRHALQEELLAAAAELRCAIVFVTHSSYEAAFLARRIVVLSPRPGRIVSEIAASLPPGAGRRNSPAYIALVYEIGERLAAARGA